MKLQVDQVGLIAKPQMKYLTVEPNAVTVNSPFSLPPFDSLAPTPLPENSPFCEDAPPSPPPSGMIYSHTPPPPPNLQPNVPTRSQSPPPSPPSIIPITPLGPIAPYPLVNISSPTPPTSQPNVPTRSLSPPPSIIPITPIGPLTPYPPGSGSISSPTPPTGPPSPPHQFGPPSPPRQFGPPSPPHQFGPCPPKHASGPPSHGVSPPVFLPPVVFPPPPGPPAAAHGGKPKSSGAAWCVAKPTVPNPIIQEALDYACGSGADCKSIQPSGHCYEPDTILAHASYAFNSYWQNSKVSGGTCDFGGTAMLVTVDPSKFITLFSNLHTNSSTHVLLSLHTK